VGTLGGVTGAIYGMGISKFEIGRYEGGIKSGSSLISIHCDDSDEVSRAKEICENAGADDITVGGEAAVHDSGENRRSETSTIDGSDCVTAEYAIEPHSPKTYSLAG